MQDAAPDGKRVLILFGSARSNGNSMRALSTLTGVDWRAFSHAEIAGVPTDSIALADHAIAPYSYTQDYPEGDAFHAIAREMVRSTHLLFVTPVYWYSMSGVMKQFFDRFTDLLTTHQPLGRALKGTQCAVLACGAAPCLSEGFLPPFQGTCDYFAMELSAHLYWPEKAPPDAALQRAFFHYIWGKPDA